MVTSSPLVEPDMIRLLIDAGCSIDDKDKKVQQRVLIFNHKKKSQ